MIIELSFVLLIGLGIVLILLGFFFRNWIIILGVIFLIIVFVFLKLLNILWGEYKSLKFIVSRICFSLLLDLFLNIMVLKKFFEGGN